MKTSAIVLGVFTLMCAIFVSCSKDDDELFVPASPTSSVSPTFTDAVEPVKNPGFLPDSGFIVHTFIWKMNQML